MPQIDVSPDIQASIEGLIRSGRFNSAEDVMRAALMTLGDQSHHGDFVAGEMDRLIDEGEESIRTGGLVPAEDVYARLDNLDTRGEPQR